jgi:hypothetical protein
MKPLLILVTRGAGARELQQALFSPSGLFHFRSKKTAEISVSK